MSDNLLRFFRRRLFHLSFRIKNLGHLVEKLSVEIKALKEEGSNSQGKELIEGDKLFECCLF